MKSRPLLALALLAAACAAHAEDGFSFGAGVDYSSGDYGSDTTTTILSVPFTARYNSGAWTWKASLPWLDVEGDPGVLPGLGNVGNTNPRGRGNGNGRGNGGGDPTQPTDDGSATGIGDLRLTGTYAFDTGTALGVDLSAQAKIATADEDKALGTGANDYGLLLDLYGKVGDATLFGGVGYARLGESEFIDTNDVFSANFGATWPVGPGSLGAAYDWRSAASETADDRSEITAFYSLRSGEAAKWQFYATTGLSDGSPDWGGGIALTWLF